MSDVKAAKKEGGKKGVDIVGEISARAKMLCRNHVH